MKPSDAPASRLRVDSSNGGVARASLSGLRATVVAVSPGAATITVAADGHSASCAVAVAANSVTKLEITGGSGPLGVGSSMKLGARATRADGSVEEAAGAAWSSSAPDVASVDEAGTVRWVASGSATVTASYGGKTASVEIRCETSRNLLRYGPAQGNGLTVAVNTDGSLALSGTPDGGVVGLLSWAQDAGALLGRALAFSAEGLPEGLSAYVIARDAKGAPTTFLPGAVELPEGTASVELSIRRIGSGEPAAADAPRVLLQLEEGASASAWVRPDEIGWGGGSVDA